MSTMLRYALIRYRGQILGWGLALFLLGFYLVPFYDTFAKQQDQLLEVLKSFPPQLMAFFGDVNTMFTVKGYLTVEFFSYLPLVVGIFAVIAGSGLLAADEENGTLDLVLAQPISRAALFAGRLLAFTIALAGILFIGWLGLIIPMGNSATFKVGAGELALPFLSLLAELLVFGTLALLLSMWLPSRRLAASLAGLILVASFFISGLARISQEIEPVAKLLPLHYYQSGDALGGLNLGWFVGLLVTAAIFAGLAGWRFQRRDIRVAGEGSWRFKNLFSRSGREPIAARNIGLRHT